MSYLHIQSVSNYYKTPNARELAHKLKDEDVEAIDYIAAEMSLMVPENVALIPLPGRSGRAASSLQLALVISKLTGNPVMDVIEGVKRTSLYQLKTSGQNIGENFFGLRLIQPISKLEFILIDGVCDTGITGISAAKLFKGDVSLLVHASHFDGGVGLLNKNRAFEELENLDIDDELSYLLQEPCSITLSMDT
jgi:hypothetical protein